MSIDVDVADGMFWIETPLQIAAVALISRRDVPDLVKASVKVKEV